MNSCYGYADDYKVVGTNTDTSDRRKQNLAMVFQKYDETESGRMQTTKHHGGGKRTAGREILRKSKIREGPRDCCLFGSFLDNSSRKESKKL